MISKFILPGMVSLHWEWKTGIQIYSLGYKLKDGYQVSISR